MFKMIGYLNKNHLEQFSLHFFLIYQRVNRRPGDRWMIRGPLEYVPPVEVEVVTKRKAIPLDENEGIYVRDIKTGKVRAICGATYMLTQDEELWTKELPPGVEELLAQGKDPLSDRSDRSKERLVITIYIYIYILLLLLYNYL